MASVVLPAPDRLNPFLVIGAALAAGILLPLVAAAAFALAFVASGGTGATMRLLARRGREGGERARLGRFAFVDRGR